MKKTRLLALGMSVAMTASLLAGCGGGSATESKAPAPEGSAPVSAEALDLKVSVASEPETMDPALNRTVDGMIMTNHLFENLYKWVDSTDGAGDDGHATAVLDLGVAAAEPEIVENEDGTYTWTFTLVRTPSGPTAIPLLPVTSCTPGSVWWIPSWPRPITTSSTWWSTPWTSARARWTSPSWLSPLPTTTPSWCS